MIDTTFSLFVLLYLKIQAIHEEHGKTIFVLLIESDFCISGCDSTEFANLIIFNLSADITRGNNRTSYEGNTSKKLSMAT